MGKKYYIRSLVDGSYYKNPLIGFVVNKKYATKFDEEKCFDLLRRFRSNKDMHDQELGYTEVIPEVVK